MSAAAGGPNAAVMPFHSGELAVQERVGVRAQMAPVGRNNIRDHMPDQHREFFAQLPFLFIAALDGSGQPWASVLTGAPGFLSAPDARTLRIGAATLPGDPLEGQLAIGAYIGTLGLVPATRRRNRANGVIAGLDAGGITLAIKQSFGNCPQYIQDRRHRVVEPSIAAGPQVLRGDRLSAADRALIARADTFFIASANVAQDAGDGLGADVSHRGGRPGFVRIDDERTLTAPDFVGNFFFNTIGNLLSQPRAGLLFVDFDSGDLLHLAVDAEVIWDGPQVQAFAGAERLMRFHVREVRRNVGALPLRWSAPQQSPVLAATGTWAEADSALAATRMRDTWRRFTVVKVKQESAAVRSFYLHAADGLGLAHFEAGQYLPIRVTLPGQDKPLLRTYTLSDAAHGQHYRISVKRDGVVSSWMHDHLRVGSEIEVLGPRGEFTFDAASRRPVVLLSAGVGVTPMMAMLNSLLVNNGRTRHAHPIYFIHGARNQHEHAFVGEVRELAARHWNLHAHIRYSAADAMPDVDDDVVRFQRSAGHVDIDFLRQVLPFDDYDFYLCGPASFMQSMYDGLRGLNVVADRIRFEAFGPATVRIDKPQVAVQLVAPSAVSIPVRFARSGASADWDGSHASLLEFAEAQGLPAPSGCRSGTCGACALPLLAGEVAYTRGCAAELANGQVLMCSAIPKPDMAAGAAIVIDL